MNAAMSDSAPNPPRARAVPAGAPVCSLNFHKQVEIIRHSVSKTTAVIQAYIIYLSARPQNTFSDPHPEKAGDGGPSHFCTLTSPKPLPESSPHTNTDSSLHSCQKGCSGLLATFQLHWTRNDPHDVTF